MFHEAIKFNQNLCCWDMSGASTDEFCAPKRCFPSGGCSAFTYSFTTHAELYEVVRYYCENESGWKDHSDFDKYG